MGNISSINFKNGNLDNQLLHNTIDRPNYAIGGEVKYNKEPLEAYNICKEMIEKAKINYANNCKARNKKFQATNYIKSVVLNIKDEKQLPMDDAMAKMEEVAKHLHDKYGFQCYQISIHRDEGHIGDNGEKHINHHAHMEICTLDDKTGFNRFKEIGPKQLSEIQTEIADLLEMKRGEKVRDSKRKRIEPRKWAMMKEQEKQATKELKQDLEQVKAENKALKQDLVSQKAVNSAFEEIRQLMIADKISTADDYKELAKYKKQAQAQQKQGLTQAELDKLIAQIHNDYANKLKAKDEELKKKNEEIEKLEKLEKAKIDEYIKSNEMEKSNKELLDSYLASADTLENARTQIEIISVARNFDDIALSQAKNTIINLKEELKNKAPKIENKSDDVENRIITLENSLNAKINDLDNENKDLKAENKRLKEFLNIHNLLDKFNDYVANLLSNQFVEKLKNMVSNHQAPNHAEPSQEIQLTPKADIQRKTNTQNKGRSGR